MIEQKKLKKIFTELPNAPGVYQMIDAEGGIIYIGKAKQLSKRVKQYFQKDYQHSTRTRKLMEKTVDIKWMVVDSELEAILLENNLIKELQPKYNVIMKDDKSYVYIKISRKEDFPRIQIVRKPQKDGAKYIGPKSAAHKVKETFKILKKIFPFRHCGLDISIKNNNVVISNKVIKYPCLDYYIKRCAAPCIGKISKEEYANIIKNVEDFLEGRMDNILKDLNIQMLEAAQNKKFERAGKIRDKIIKIKDILEKQIISDPNQINTDVINYCTLHDRAYFNLFQVRDGKLINQENFILNANEVEENIVNAEILEAFLSQYYSMATDTPQEVIIPHQIENTREIEELLMKESNKKVKIAVPKIGDKNKLLELSLKNAQIFADRNRPSWQEESDLSEKALDELKEILKLPKTPKRIECYDISHLSGTDTVGSMVVFEKGVPKSNMYRKFRIRTVLDKPDDYRSMEEILYRRFQKIAFNDLYKEFKFKKATKKYAKEIAVLAEKAGVNRNKEDYNVFYILEKNHGKKKNLAAIAKLKKYSEKASTIEALAVAPEERGKKLGHKLIKELIKKSQTKRIYILCKKELTNYYLSIGFEEIKKIPEELKAGIKKSGLKNPVMLAFDKIKMKEDISFGKTPDLVIIDGGKGQLSSAEKIFKDFKLKIPRIALAKQLEEIFLPQRKTPIILTSNSEALKLLQRARDEAHRFAISYNKNLRSKHFS